MAGYLGSVPVPQATQHRESFTCTEGQTSFATAGYTAQFVDVYLNGSHLSPADFTATNGSDVVLAVAASADDVCDIISYTPFEIADQTFTGTIDITGELKTSTLGTSNFRAGVNAGNSIVSGGNYNVTVGDEAGTAITTGDNNTAVGYQALYVNTTGAELVAVGKNALDANTTATRNVAVGNSALGAVTTGSNNTALGDRSLIVSTGEYNTAVGSDSLYSNTTASNNTAVGYRALNTNTTGGFSTAVGASALKLATGLYNDAFGYVALGANAAGTNNSAFGGGALESNTTGSYNTAVGRTALNSNTTASNNTAVGYQAGEANTTGHDNVWLGYQAGYTETTAKDSVGIGYRSAYSLTTGHSNTVVGRFAGYALTTGTNNTFIGYTNEGEWGAGHLITTGAKNTILGPYNGNQNSLDIRTADGNIVLADGDGNPRFYYYGPNNYWNLGTTNGNVAGNNVTGMNFYDSGFLGISRDGGTVLTVNRKQDGTLVEFKSAAGSEGSISISGSTTSFNGFSGLHESSGIPTDTAVGTVVSTIDELDVYPATQKDSVTDEQVTHPKAGQDRIDHAKVKVSDTAGDSCVYGVVANFNVQGKVNVTSVGIGSVRVTGSCAKGDLLESKGDGTAKVQSDDIIRSKTLGKVTIGNSNTGVKLVSCVMYCG